MSVATAFLPYHEPDIVTILVLSSFILALNVVNHWLNSLIYCGLLGQVFIGVAWGTPGAKWLDEGVEAVVVQVGYLGLILLVYEGGLETNFKSLKANVGLSVAVAMTGICMPVALSFVLQSLVDATPLQAFVAGAALCSTSLGTTFTVLGTSGLLNSRLGTVLTSAAMMDDVVGLVMVQVISNLGPSSSGFKAVTVVRPVAVSLAFVIAVPLGCLLVAKPLTQCLERIARERPHSKFQRLFQGSYTPFIVHTTILLGLITGSSYAGTSNLFAAYLAGASISWWDSTFRQPVLESSTGTSNTISVEHVIPTVIESVSEHHPAPEPSSSDGDVNSSDAIAPSSPAIARDTPPCSTCRAGREVYQEYFSTSVHRVLTPFFFASIGFAVPISQMWEGKVLWRGLIYTLLMLFSKLVTGVWLVRLELSMPSFSKLRSLANIIPFFCTKRKTPDKISNKQKPEQHNIGSQIINGPAEAVEMIKLKEPPGTTPPTPASDHAGQHAMLGSRATKKPLSLYPAAMLGTAMTARGEIGFLIASLAESTGLFQSSSKSTDGGSDIYLIVVWAILLCTIIGPLAVGTLVKRVNSLQKDRLVNKSKLDPLGVWDPSEL